jgi:hypothetical protein
LEQQDEDEQMNRATEQLAQPAMRSTSSLECGQNEEMEYCYSGGNRRQDQSVFGLAVSTPNSKLGSRKPLLLPTDALKL